MFHLDPRAVAVGEEAHLDLLRRLLAATRMPGGERYGGSEGRIVPERSSRPSRERSNNRRPTRPSKTAVSAAVLLSEWP